jgi:hypothetical protein
VDECFKQIDTNNDGKLSYEEFKAAVESQKLLINCFVHYSSPVLPVPSSSSATTTTTSSSSVVSSASVMNNTNTNTTKNATTTLNAQDSSKRSTTSESNIPNLNLETSLTSHFEDPITPPHFEF